MERPNLIAEAMAAVNASLRVGPNAGEPILALINAVLAERDAAQSASIQMAIHAGRNVADRIKAARAETTAEDVLIGRSPNDGNILADLQRAITDIIHGVRARREREGVTAEYFSDVLRLSRLVEEFEGMNGALAPTQAGHRHGS